MAGGTGENASDSGRSWALTDTLVETLESIRRSFLLFIAALGVVLIVLGFTVLGGTGVLAAMFGIWGVSAILYAAIGVGFLRLIGYR